MVLGDDWEMQSNTSFSHAYVYIEESGKTLSFQDNDDVFRGILKSLQPKSNNDGVIEGKPDYVLSFHAGMDPCDIPVWIYSDYLVFSFAGHNYFSENNEVFVRQISDLTKK